MDPTFFEQPILNSPYEYPCRHWELNAGRQPTNRILRGRRKVAFITPMPKPEKQKGIQQEKILFDAATQALGTDAQQYDLTAFIGGVRHRVVRWRELPDRNTWSVTPETSRLVAHWRSHRFGVHVRLSTFDELSGGTSYRCQIMVAVPRQIHSLCFFRSVCHAFARARQR